MTLLHFIKKILRIGFKRKGLLIVFAYMLLLAVSSVLINMVEPDGTPLTEFGQALWWSIVTSTTVGYGDLYPASSMGKIIAVTLPMFVGIGLGAAFITHIASLLIERRDKKMHGEKEYKGEGHIVLVGATDETQYLIEQMLMDEHREERDIVLLAEIDRHPMPDLENVIFIKGRVDTKSSLKKANIGQAAQVVIHTGSDETSLFALINTLKLKKQDSEVTVRCLSTESLDTFSNVAGNFEIIMQMTAEMVVQAMQDKVHIPLQVLLRNDEDEEIYYVIVPELEKELLWWDLHNHLKQKHDFLTLAMRTPDNQIIVNPSTDTVVSKGSGIWLIAKKRPIHIKWV